MICSPFRLAVVLANYAQWTDNIMQNPYVSRMMQDVYDREAFHMRSVSSSVVASSSPRLVRGCHLPPPVFASPPSSMTPFPASSEASAGLHSEAALPMMGEFDFGGGLFSQEHDDLELDVPFLALPPQQTLGMPAAWHLPL